MGGLEAPEAKMLGRTKSASFEGTFIGGHFGLFAYLSIVGSGGFPIDFLGLTVSFLPRPWN